MQKLEQERSQSPGGQERTNATLAWPAGREQLVNAGYHFKYARKCRLCDALIEFWTTPNHKIVALDRPDKDERRMPHLATCAKVREYVRQMKAKQGDLFG
jgi:hypothetical protein